LLTKIWINFGTIAQISLYCAITPIIA